LKRREERERREKKREEKRREGKKTGNLDLRVLLYLAKAAAALAKSRRRSSLIYDPKTLA
jgi:hypothetical protein